MVAAPAKKRRKHPPLAIGQRFGRLVVTGIVPPTDTLPTQAECMCDCGTQRTVAGGNLKHGLTKSCGCLNRELSRTRCGPTSPNFRHGLSGSRTYRHWAKIKCDRLHADRWNSFELFVADMGLAPEGHSLVLIGNATIYGPSTAQWAKGGATQNHSLSRRFTVNGVSKCQSAWARDLGVSRQVIDERIKRGWSVRAAVTTPISRFPNLTNGASERRRSPANSAPPSPSPRKDVPYDPRQNHPRNRRRVPAVQSAHAAAL